VREEEGVLQANTHGLVHANREGGVGEHDRVQVDEVGDVPQRVANHACVIYTRVARDLHPARGGRGRDAGFEGLLKAGQGEAGEFKHIHVVPDMDHNEGCEFVCRFPCVDCLGGQVELGRQRVVPGLDLALGGDKGG
jgi:hypothetical protein